MGWKDQSTPLGEDPPSAPSAPSAPKSGWQSQSTPLDQPASAPSAPAVDAPPLAANPYGNVPPPPAIWNRPADQGLGGYLKQVWDFQTQGGDKAAQDYSRAIADTGTFGQGDRLQSALTGNTLEQERALTQAAHDRLGAGDLIAQVAGSMPLSAIGTGVRAADAARALTGGSRLAGYGAGIVGSGLENAGIAAAGTLGHGGSMEDAGRSATVGGLLGAATGVFGVGSMRPMGAAKTEAEAGAARDAAYAPMKRVAFGENDLTPAYTSAQNGLTAAQTDDLTEAFRPGGKIDSQLNLISQRGAASADEIDGFQRNLQNAARSGGDKVLAGRISDNLRDVLENASPITGHSVGHAADLQDVAKPAAAQLANARMIAEARRVGGLPGSGGVGETLPDAAQSALKNNPQFYQGDADAAMKGLAGAGGWVPGGYLVKHAVVYPSVGAALGAIGGGASGYAGAGKGEDPWLRAGERALEFGAGGLAAGVGLPRLKNYLVNRALTTAGPTLTAGVPYRPPEAVTGDNLRRVLMGRGAAGGFGPLSVYGSAPGVGASGAVAQ